jgi:hypothetical protein
MSNSMILVTFFLILLGLHQITSAITVLQQADIDILRQAVQPAPPIQALLSLGWAVICGSALFRLWRRSPWASAQAVGILLAFAAYSLLRLLFGAQADYDRGRQSLWGVLLAMIGVASLILYRRTRSNSGMGMNGESKS